MEQEEMQKIAQQASQAVNDINTGLDVAALLTETKPWYQSKTIIGGVVTIAAALGGAFGLHIDPTTQQGLVAAILYLTGGVGGVVSIIGRIAAEYKVGR